MILAHGHKVDNLFTYISLSIPRNMSEVARYTAEPSNITLWHHRLAHTSYSTLENMKRLKTSEGFLLNVHHRLIPQCNNCPYGKQTHAPFKKMEDLPSDIGDIIVSDLCGPFEVSIGRYKYFITWMDLKTRFVSIDFLKDKECSMVMESFKKYMAWLLQQKKADVKKIRMDNKGEYMGSEFKYICSTFGIIHETTSPNMPEHKRMLQEGALILQHDASLST